MPPKKKPVQSKKTMRPNEPSNGLDINQLREKCPTHLMIPILLLAAVLIMLVAQYHSAHYSRLASSIFNGIDLYKVLEASAQDSQSELKSKFRRLLIKYHPDTNPNCSDCAERIEKILSAWKVLGDPLSRKEYDENAGVIQRFPSATLTITPALYQQFMLQPGTYWLVQIYDSSDDFSINYALIWQSLYHKYGNQMSFGRINIWSYPELASRIPFKFVNFPSFFTYHDGVFGQCPLENQKVVQSLETCILDFVKQQTVLRKKHIGDISKNTNKMQVALEGRIEFTTEIKLLHYHYSAYIDFHVLSTPGNTIWALPANGFLNGKEPPSFTIQSNNAVNYAEYKIFLQSLVIQQVNECQAAQLCMENPCLFYLQDINEIPEDTPYPLLRLKNSEQFFRQLEKKVSKQNKDFKIGSANVAYFQDGAVAFGNVRSIQVLQEGPRNIPLELQCKQTSWLEAGIGFMADLFQ